MVKSLKTQAYYPDQISQEMSPLVHHIKEFLQAFLLDRTVALSE